MIVISFQKELNRVDDRTTPEQDSALRSAMLGLRGASKLKNT